MAVAALVITVILLMIFVRMARVENNTIVVASESTSAYYDGKPVTDSGWKLVEGELGKGHKLDVTVTGSRTDVGISENTFSVAVKDKSGKDVSKEYNIICKPGSITVKAKRLTLVADSAMKMYDGEPLVADGYTLENPSALVENATLYVRVSGSITDVGTAENVITELSIVNQDGEQITSNYRIKAIKGELRVYSENALIIKSGDAQKYFNGEPLKNDEWELVSGELLSGHELVVSVVGSAVFPGSKKNEFSVDIIDEEGNYMTQYYDIVKLYGDLIILEQ